jgi:hypothetical protein
MDTSCLDVKFVGVRTVLHMSPSVMAAAIVSAQRNGFNLREWLDTAVASHIGNDHPDGAAPWSFQVADLFAQVASCSPEILRGPWALLYEHVLRERDLWHHPEPTSSEVAEGDVPDAPYLVPLRLRKAWPRLVATVFML